MIRFRAVIVHGMEDIRVTLNHARKAGSGAALLSAPGGMALGGCGWWLAMMRRAGAEFPDVPFQSAADCTGMPGLAGALLRAAIPLLPHAAWHSGGQAPLFVIMSPSPASAAVSEMADSVGVGIIPHPPAAFILPLRRHGKQEFDKTLLKWLADPA